MLSLLPSCSSNLWSPGLGSKSRPSISLFPTELQICTPWPVLPRGTPCHLIHRVVDVFVLSQEPRAFCTPSQKREGRSFRGWKKSKFQKPHTAKTTTVPILKSGLDSPVPGGRGALCVCPNTLHFSGDLAENRSSLTHTSLWGQGAVGLQPSLGDPICAVMAASSARGPEGGLALGWTPGRLDCCQTLNR